MQELASKLSNPNSQAAEARLRIGIIAESRGELDRLKQLLFTSKYELVFAEAVDDVSDLPTKVEVWVLRLSQASSRMETFIEALVQEDAPMVIDDASEGEQSGDEAYYIEKVDKAYALHTMHSKKSAVARNVWVLAASAGGPEAVIEFLSALDKSEAITSSTAFIYAQHIDDVAIDNLIHALQRKTHFKVERCQSGAMILAGQIYVLSPVSEVEISGGKSLNLTGDAWKGDYAPSISQIIARVARIYKQRSGALVFSGMGDDGANAVRLMKAMGGHVYSQSLGTCAVDSMPKEAQATGCVDYTGSPQELAMKLADTIQYSEP